MRTATPAELAKLSDAYDILVSLGFPDAAAGVDEAMKRNAEAEEPPDDPCNECALYCRECVIVGDTPPCRQAVAPRKASTTLDILAVLAIAGVAGIMFTGGNLFASALDFGVILAALIGAWMLWSASGVRDRRPVIAALGGLLCLPAGIWIGLALASHGVVGGLTGIGCCVAWCAFLGVRSRRSENET